VGFDDTARSRIEVVFDVVEQLDFVGMCSAHRSFDSGPSS
jgi:hypothetical protein